MLVMLVMLCIFFSAITFKRQPSEGAAAAKGVTAVVTDAFSTDARAEDLPRYVANLQVIERDVFVVAETEIELICPDAPGTIVVATADRESAWRWRDLWPDLSWNDPTPAAVAAESGP